MPPNNRAYKRNEPYRSSTLFIIACEGEVREKEYFEYFKQLSRKIKITVLESEHGNSAPSKVRERILDYNDSIGIQPEDQVWFVIDKDKWSQEIFRDIDLDCRKNANWHMAVSNPCFEVWLYLHKLDIDSLNASNCRECKQQLNDKIPGGYNRNYFVLDVQKAIKRAKGLDSNPSHYMPELRVTKVYQLIESIFEFVGPSTVNDHFGT